MKVNIIVIIANIIILCKCLVQIGPFRFVNTLNEDNVNGCGLSRFNRIVYGQDSIEGAYPFMALLYRFNIPHGSAVIISDKWILSSAHNFRNSKNPDHYLIGLGSVNMSRLQKYPISKIFVHDGFKNKRSYDIAMIKLKSPLTFGETIRPICLPDYPFEPFTENKGRVIGWGYHHFNDTELHDILQEVDLEVIDLKKCSLLYSTLKEQIFRTQICTFSNEKKDACIGDSGGPFFVYKNLDRAVLYGIVSFGVTCGDKFPGVYTAVSYFLYWIDQILNHEKD